MTMVVLGADDDDGVDVVAGGRIVVAVSGSGLFRCGNALRLPGFAQSSAACRVALANGSLRTYSTCCAH